MHAVVRQDPFVNMTGGPGYELPLLYFSICCLIFIMGPGVFSLDAKVSGFKPNTQI